MSTIVWPLWNTGIWHAPLWNNMAQQALGRPTAADYALLILLGVSLLALQVSRERYFKVWIAGWAALVASGLIEHIFPAENSARHGRRRRRAHSFSESDCFRRGYCCTREIANC